MSNFEAKTLTTYAELSKYADLFARPNGLGFLIILGNAGIGKTSILKARLKEAACGWLTGSLSAYFFYKQLYNYLDKPIAIDDVDALFKDKASCNLLKCVCQTEQGKLVQWGKATKQLNQEAIPRSFHTTSRICILANKMPRADADLLAVLNRATVINFYPSASEVHKHARSFVADKEIYDFFGQYLSHITRPSLRIYTLATEEKRLGLDWKTNLMERWKDADKVTLIGAIMADTSLTDSASRVDRFIEMGGGSRATWFRCLQQWKQAQGSDGKDGSPNVKPKKRGKKKSNDGEADNDIFAT